MNTLADTVYFYIKPLHRGEQLADKWKHIKPFTAVNTLAV